MKKEEVSTAIEPEVMGDITAEHIFKRLQGWAISSTYLGHSHGLRYVFKNGMAIVLVGDKYTQFGMQGVLDEKDWYPGGLPVGCSQEESLKLWELVDKSVNVTVTKELAKFLGDQV